MKKFKDFLNEVEQVDSSLDQETEAGTFRELLQGLVKTVALFKNPSAKAEALREIQASLKHHIVPMNDAAEKARIENLLKFVYAQVGLNWTRAGSTLKLLQQYLQEFKTKIKPVDSESSAFKQEVLAEIKSRLTDFQALKDFQAKYGLLDKMSPQDIETALRYVDLKELENLRDSLQ